MEGHFGGFTPPGVFRWNVSKWGVFQRFAAKLIARDPNIAAKILDSDTLEEAQGPWRAYGRPYDPFGAEQHPDADDEVGEIVFIEDDYDESRLGFIF
jgi:hypothetical protein